MKIRKFIKIEAIIKNDVYHNQSYLNFHCVPFILFKKKKINLKHVIYLMNLQVP